MDLSPSGRPALLVVNCDRQLTVRQRQSIAETMAPIAESIGAAVLIADAGMQVNLHHDLAPLIEAISEQTEAVNALTQSTLELTQAVLSSLVVDEDEQDDHQQYLNARPS